jgi:hypothetical protein
MDENKKLKKVRDQLEILKKFIDQITTAKVKVTIILLNN